MKKVLFLILLTYSFIQTQAQTPVSGGIYSNAVWDSNGSPYIVSGNLVVFEGVTLDIQPGVDIRFEKGAGLELRGIMNAIGTEKDSISFTSNAINPSMYDWKGLIVKGSSEPLHEGDQLTMEYVNCMYTNTFVDMDIAYHGPYIFRNCRFAFNNVTNNDGGSPSVLFDECLFENNNTGLRGGQWTNTVKNSKFINNKIGVENVEVVENCYFTGHTEFALSPYGKTFGCIVEKNNLGAKVGLNSVNNTFINNVIKDNEKGVHMDSWFNTPSIHFTGNTICNNREYDLFMSNEKNANLAYNCWCTSDSTEIRNKIIDGYKNTDYGLVNFLPAATSCPVANIGFEETFQIAEITAYPNPVNDILNLTINEVGSFNFSLIDLSGRTSASGKLTSNVQIDVSELQPGLYVLLISNQSDYLARKMVVVN